MDNADKVRLPKAVYYQCIWIVKDLDRLCRLETVKKHEAAPDEIVLFEDEESTLTRNVVADEAEWKLACIRAALKAVPEEYRMYTLESIADGSMTALIAHENTLKKWRRTFIRELAYKLNLI